MILGFPLRGPYQELGVLAHPVQIGIDRCSQPLERLLEAQIRVINPLNLRERRK